MEIRDERSIDASVDDVWRLTVDVERWPELTPTIRSVERLDDGPFGVGSRARIVQPMQRPAVWTVTRFEPPHAFAWETTTMGVTMVGTHDLVAEGDGCRSVLGLEVRGRGAGAFRALFGRRIQRAIETENRGFERAASRPTT
ncbi:MAG: SRPBCC family protein [Acidimicrobiales bacterium]|nr:SRPBCC family protein [Acidimicrobiales bacterium]HRW38676.1 SRPBCC family protein [Aquihabitans sp.]